MIGQGLASLGICAVACVLAYKEEPFFAVLAAVMGLGAIWGIP